MAWNVTTVYQHKLPHNLCGHFRDLVSYIAYYLRSKSFTFFVDYFAITKALGECVTMNSMKAHNYKAGDHKTLLRMKVKKVKTLNSETFSL